MVPRERKEMMGEGNVGVAVALDADAGEAACSRLSVKDKTAMSAVVTKRGEEFMWYLFVCHKGGAARLARREW